MPTSHAKELVLKQQVLEMTCPASTKSIFVKKILPALVRYGVARVVVDYSGYGSESSIDSISFLDAAGSPMAYDPDKEPLVARLQSVCSEFLPEGFEHNEGGQGDLFVDVQAGTITVEHEENYIATTERTYRYQC